MSKLIRRIDARLRVSKDPQERGVLFARRGIYLARMGLFVEADRIIQYLRRRFPNGSDPKISIWVMMTEGVRDFYSTLNPSAYDRIFRAQLLSLAIGDSHSSALASAWRAHLEFERSDYGALREALENCFSNAKDKDHDALVRAAIILMQAFTLMGDRAQAQGWYMMARNHALAAGDQISLEALVHNRASFGVASLRLKRCSGPLSEPSLRLINGEMDSALGFRAIYSAQALRQLLSLAAARLLIAEDRHGEALMAMVPLTKMGPFAANNFNTDMLNLEIAYCLCMMKELDQAVSYLVQVNDDALLTLDVDDRLVADWMLMEMARTDQRFGNLSLTEAKYLRTKEELEQSFRDLAAALGGFQPV